MSGDGGFSNIGDLSFILKYAFLNDRDTNNVLSGGMVVTVPTGPNITFVGGDTFHSVLLQPYAGGIYNWDRFYAHGFSSVVVPTGSQETVLMFNSVGVAHRTLPYSEERFLSSVTPTLEGHLTTPFNNRSPDGNLYVPDIFDLTGGVHLGLGRRSIFTVGASLPLTGPKPFSNEVFGQLNIRF